MPGSNHWVDVQKLNYNKRSESDGDYLQEWIDKKVNGEHYYYTSLKNWFPEPKHEYFKSQIFSFLNQAVQHRVVKYDVFGNVFV